MGGVSQVILLLRPALWLLLSSVLVPLTSKAKLGRLSQQNSSKPDSQVTAAMMSSCTEGCWGFFI